MAHLIDKDALVAEIDRRKIGYNVDGKHSVEYDTTRKILNIINTLEVKEVDLEKETDKYFAGWTTDSEYGDAVKPDYHGCSLDACKDIAKHFFELGLSVSNSTKVTAQDIDNVLKENGVNPYSKEAKIIKESYFMAIEKLTQKGELYDRQSTENS